MMTMRSLAKFSFILTTQQIILVIKLKEDLCFKVVESAYSEFEISLKTKSLIFQN